MTFREENPVEAAALGLLSLLEQLLGEVGDRLARGQRLTEILKQPQYQPMGVENQVLVIWAATKGYVDDIAIENVRKFEGELLQFVQNSHPSLLQSIREKKALTDEITADLKQVLQDFKELWKERYETALAATV